MASHFVRGMLALTLFAALVRAEDWPAFRGPTGMGITSQADLPLAWNGKDGTSVLWKSPLPGTAGQTKFDNSQSSPIIWRDRIFVTNAFWPQDSDQSQPPQQHVACYALADGKQIWDVTVPAGPWKLGDLRGGYAAPTPATDGVRVYALFGSSVLAALDFQGAIIWSREIPDWKDFDVCIASSPVLHDGRLYVLADRNNRKSTLTAIDPATGGTLWEQPRTTGFSHTTPVFIRHEGRAMMLIGGASELQALDPTGGERLWWCQTPGDVTSPVYAAGLVYTDSGRGGAAVCVDPGGEGDVTATHVKWRESSIPEGLSSPLIVGDRLYRLHNPGILRCTDLKGGEVLFRERLEGLSVSSSPIAAPGGRIYLASAGKTYVLAAGPKLEVLAVNDLGEPHPSSAAVSGGRLIIKGSKHLFCVGAK
jgi:outer membrane protein assembly factor BamB